MKRVVVPIPGRGVQIPVLWPPVLSLAPPVFELLHELRGTTVGVRAQVWHRHASPSDPPPPELRAVKDDPWCEPLEPDGYWPPGETTDVMVTVGITVTVAPEGSANSFVSIRL